MRCLVTGGAGFIGSHLCEELLARGDKVRCVDNLSSGIRENIEHLSENPNFEFVERDVCDVWPLPVSDKRRPELIFHLASLASPWDYRRHPIPTITANTQGTLNVLNFAKQVKAQVVYVSTSEVYGDPEEVPQKEESTGALDPLSLRAPYCLAKATGEALVYGFHRMWGLDAAVARIFNTYGPRMRTNDGRCVPTFIARALSGKDLPVHGTGSQTRSLCYVADTVRGLLALGDALKQPLMPINIGSDQETSIQELAEMIRDLSGASVDLQYIEQPCKDDPQRRCPDISRAKKHLGWSPQIELKDGLLRTFEWFFGRAV